MNVVEAVNAAQGFDWANFWAAVAAIVGLIALISVVVSVIAFRRQFPKRRIDYVVDTQRLVSNELPSGSVEFKVRGVSVENPYITTVRMLSNSRADIPSGAFDGGEPIVVRIEPGGAVLLGIERSGPDQIVIDGGRGEGMDWAEFPIQPQLIRKRSSAKFSFVSEGRPTVSVISPLVDIEVREVKTATGLLLPTFNEVAGQLIASFLR